MFTFLGCALLCFAAAHSVSDLVDFVNQHTGDDLIRWNQAVEDLKRWKLAEEDRLDALGRQHGHTSNTKDVHVPRMTNLIVNGNFETGVFTPWVKTSNGLNPGSPSIVDVVQNSVTSNLSWLLRIGTVSPNGGVYQDVSSTVPGASYTLKFDVYKTVTTGNFATIYANGVAVATVPTALSYDWVTFTSTFVATTSTTRIAVLAYNSPSFTRFDNFVLTQNPPEYGNE